MPDVFWWALVDTGDDEDSVGLAVGAVEEVESVRNGEAVDEAVDEAVEEAVDEAVDVE